MSRSTDIVVIGGGIIGCAVAYFAARRGLKVTLIDQPRRGRATSASAGGLWPIGESVGLGCGVIFHKTHLLNGDRATHPAALPRVFFDFATRSNAMFPELTATLRDMTGFDIEYDRTDLYFLMYDEGDESFGRFVRERCPDGRRMTTWLTPEELARVEPATTRDNRGAVIFHGDDQVNPYRLSDAFRAAAKAHGADILTHTEVTGIAARSGKIRSVETRDGVIFCSAAVNAAGSWAGRVGSMVGLEIPIRPVRGQMLGTSPLPLGTIKACFSTSDCYLLQKRHGEIIIGSTTEEVGFASDTTTDAMQTLAAGAVRALPMLRDVAAKRTWSGLRPGTPDELPILGPVEGLDGYFNACGISARGSSTPP